jgi:hypothetical protein
MSKILEKYKQLSEIPSDINEHLVTLKKYTEECNTIVEMGVRSIVSTWAFLAGNPKKLTSLDLYNPTKFGGNLQEVYDAASLTNIDFSFIECDSLTYEMQPCDLLFIDTWHCYLQLKKELTRHHSKVNKYIILHDTVSYANVDEKSADEMGVLNNIETNLPKGLWSAVEEFLYENKNWVVWEKKPNNNGLTILKRTDIKPIETITYNKKVALISSFCDTQEKLDVLEKNIKIIKSHNLDVITISPFTLPEHINKLCDYVFITKDNPVLEWPVRGMYAWRKLKVNGVTHELAKAYSDYGFAGLTQIKQLSNIALNLDYDQFYHMIYDIKIDENVIEGFSSSRTCNVYPSKRGETIWAVGLHYMIFDRENLKNFISNITLENYLSVKNGEAFAWLHSIKDKVGYTIEETPVEDEIYYYEDHDFFNMSPIDGFKFFIENHGEKLKNIRLYFYDHVGEKEIEVNVDGNKTKHTVKNYDVIDLGFDKLNYKPVIITYDSIDYDITDIIVNIKHNILNIG